MSGAAPRKREHLELCLSDDVAFRSGANGLEAYELLHDALPELNLDDIDLSTSFLGHKLKLPLMISSMTGGTEDAQRINRVLARGAAEAGCAMAVGSQRAAIEDLSLAETFAIRDVAPDIPLFGNLGAVQLNYGYGAEECVKAVEMIEGDGLFLHLNSLQEAMQPEGNRDFRGLVDKIRQLSRDLPFPVLLKTTGNGVGPRTVSKFVGLPIAGLEVSGAGGTSWARIESLRAKDRAADALFGDWGESTAESVVRVRKSLPEIPLIASGGMADGGDLAKAMALGADLGGMARPLLQAADSGADALRERLARVAWELRVSCFYAGRGAARELDRSDLRRCE